jgi:hypothetical protein
MSKINGNMWQEICRRSVIHLVSVSIQGENPIPVMHVTHTRNSKWHVMLLNPAPDTVVPTFAHPIPSNLPIAT